jgi:sugar porter (SP) family MFS transporter
MNNKSNFKWYAFYVMAFAGLGGFLYGFDVGVISGAIVFMQEELHLTERQLSFIVAAVLGGGSIATLISGPLADLIGRRIMIIFSSILFVAGIIVTMTACTFNAVMWGRLIQGVGVGIITIVMPLYIIETTPADLRGRSVTLFQLFLTTGILISATSDIFFHTTGNWRGMFSVALIPGTIFFVGSLFLVKSPRWLFKKGNTQKAFEVLMKIVSKDEAEKSLKELTELERIEKSSEKLHLGAFFKKNYFLPFIIALFIAILNQLTGINALIQFSTYIIKESGISSVIVAMTGTAGIAFMNFIVTVIAFILIDKWGRRPLILLGTSGTCISLVFLGIVSYFLEPSGVQGYLTILGLISFICFFAIGPGVVVWLAVSEILPLKIRSITAAIALFANSLSSAILAAIFLDLSKIIGYAGNFWLCSFFTFIYFFITYSMLPESKGKTLEEVEAYWQKDI